MGEVYRADDLKLGQPVALKFLPDRLSSDRTLLDRFFAEVRTSRSVAHPNVCRVYDIGEVDGRHFLSMEYVDGEDLASLLRRIGRLPPDKALELSRQICAGLAAAHERGILHRDLKPANVMVDGRGRARIMDFGLAVAAGEVGTESEIGGTPAYMAPEQFAGRGASVRSDLYALGLVLYELYTGKRAFDAGSLADYHRKHAEDPPTSPSVLVAGMEPAVERAILRCLEKDPAQRPSSAARVAAALPGGDPLEAALAAGETPSPEMVAAAGSAEQIEPRLARGLLAAVVVLLAALVALVGKTNFLAAIGSEKPPEVLRARAREILAGFGLPGRPADWAADILQDDDFVDWVTEHDRSTDRWRARHRARRDRLLLQREPDRPHPPGFHLRPLPGTSCDRVRSASRDSVGNGDAPSRHGRPAEVARNRAEAARAGRGTRRRSRLERALSRGGARHEPLPSRRIAMDSAGLRGRARRVGGSASRAPGRDDAGRGGRFPGPPGVLPMAGSLVASGPRHLRYAQLRSATRGAPAGRRRSSFSFSAASGWPVKTFAPAGATGAARRGWRRPPWRSPLRRGPSARTTCGKATNST